MGRKLLWPEIILAKFPARTLARIAKVLRPDESRLDFLREAIERLLKGRERRLLKTDKRRER